MREHQVQCLLMGGQACVLYGAAEFSRDTDLAILASEENAERLAKPRSSPCRLSCSSLSTRGTPCIFAASIPKPPA